MDNLGKKELILNATVEIVKSAVSGTTNEIIYNTNNATELAKSIEIIYNQLNKCFNS